MKRVTALHVFGAATRSDAEAIAHDVLFPVARCRQNHVHTWSIRFVQPALTSVAHRPLGEPSGRKRRVCVVLPHQGCPRSLSLKELTNVALWILQGLLALAIFGAGTFKLTTPHAELAERRSGP